MQRHVRGWLRRKAGSVECLICAFIILMTALRRPFCGARWNHRIPSCMPFRIAKGTSLNDEYFADYSSIFELSQRNFTSLLNIPVMVLFPFLHTITRHWTSPLHLCFTYLVPLLSFVVSFDGLVSTMRCRTPEEIRRLLDQPDLDLSGWEFNSGNRMVFWPFVNIYWYAGVKRANQRYSVYVSG